MNVLEKILEEIEEATSQEDAPIYLGNMEVDWYVRESRVKEIICSHMADAPDADNDWIPVDEELPPFGERLQATILHHEWITDYDSSWVPEKEKTYYQEYTEVCEIYPMGGMWFYTCKENEYEGEVAYIKPAKDLGSPISGIIAWRPLPEPYKQN